MTKSTTRRRPTALPERYWAQMRLQYIEPREIGAVEMPPTMADLARMYSVPYSAVLRRARREGWQLEKTALEWRNWHTHFGKGARTGEEFVSLQLNDSDHAPPRTPEDRERCSAMYWELWNRYTAGMRAWEEFKGERSAVAPDVIDLATERRLRSERRA